MGKQNILKLFISILVCLYAGIIGFIYAENSISTWYITLKKPSFAMPEWMFAPVWIALSLSMGISMFMVWKKGFYRIDVGRAMYVFFIQLVLSVLWPLAFFGLCSPFCGFIMMMFLFLAMILTITTVYPICRVSALCLVPYLFWVIYGAVLNFSVMMINTLSGDMLL